MSKFESTRQRNMTLATILGIAASAGFRLPEYKPKEPKPANPEAQAAAEAKRLRKQAKRVKS